MTTLTQSVVSKASVAFVAAAMVFSLVAPLAKADATSDLQAQIAALMAQIEALKAGTTMTTTTTTTGGSCVGIPAPLTVGSTGANVTALQNALIAAGQSIPAGATGLFGPQTKAALAAWQSANGVMPAVGYYGPITAAAWAAKCAASTPTTTPGSTSTTTTTTTTTTTLSGEASLDTTEVNTGDDRNNVEEGSEYAQVAEIVTNFSDGDARISRLDISLVGRNTPTEVDPWRVFDTASLWVDGKKIAEVDATDKDNYLDENAGTIRFSGLDVVAMEDEDTTFVVALSVQSSVDGAGSDADWSVGLESLRYEDAEGVTTTEESSLTTDTADFSIDEVGAGDDLNLEDSDENPDATTLELAENDNTEAAIFAFDLSADDSDTTINLDNLVSLRVTVALASTTGGSNMDTLVNDYRLEIGGKSFDADSYTGSGTTTVIDFDINGDITIDANETVTAVLYADFNDMDTLDEGSTIFVSVAPGDIDAEGDVSGETVTLDGSTITGNTHTLRTKGVSVKYVSDDVTAVANNDTISSDNAADYALKFEVTSFGDTVYLPFGASRTTALADGVEYSIIDTNTNAVVTTGTSTPGLTTNGGTTVTKTNSFKVDGSAVQFTLNVNFDPIASGSYKVRVNKINFSNGDNGTGDTTQDVSALNIETDQITIQN